MQSNFSNGTRCQPVNGWFVALHRQDGAKKVGGAVKAYKKGDLAWLPNAPILNQMIVLDQFEQLPVLVCHVPLCGSGSQHQQSLGVAHAEF